MVLVNNVVSQTAHLRSRIGAGIFRSNFDPIFQPALSFHTFI